MNPPQNVTSRYVRNLIFKGKNDEFAILELKKEYSIIDGINVGDYFVCLVRASNGHKYGAAGVTIEQSIRHALEKNGVTFR